MANKKQEVKKEVINDKPLNEKNIIERHTQNKPEGGTSFNLASALSELDHKIKSFEQRLQGLEEAMQFLSEWYNTTQRTEILIPKHLKDELDGKSKIIL